MGGNGQDRVRHPRLTLAAAGLASPAGPGLAAPALVAVAHGSRDPRAAATVSELLEVVRERAGELDVRAAFLDHSAPSLPQALGSLEDRASLSAVVVPLLLTAAYHSKTDIPAQLAVAAAAEPELSAACADPLGPHPLLTAALMRRLGEAGVAVGDPDARAATGVVLAAAGSSDPAANATIAALAARWQREQGWRAVLPAYASAAGPRPADAVTALRSARYNPAGDGPVVVATYLLAPGYFADKVRDAALRAGAEAVSGVLGAAPEVADTVIKRYLDAAGAARPGDAPGRRRSPVPARG